MTDPVANTGAPAAANTETSPTSGTWQAASDDLLARARNAEAAAETWATNEAEKVAPGYGKYVLWAVGIAVVLAVLWFVF